MPREPVKENDGTVAVVLNWNRADDTIRCLEAVRRSRPAPPRVIVVDNGSVDESVSRIRARFPDVELIELPTNLGYAGGNNVGIASALASGAERVMLLNNDAVVDEHCVERLAAVLATNSSAGVAGPVVLLPNQRIWAAGGELSFRENVTRLRGHGMAQNGQFHEDEDVDYVPGCVLMIRRDVLERVGLLAEEFFCYMEDVDFGHRVREAGFTNRLVARARAVHHASSSTGGGYTPARKYMNAVNSVHFLKRHGTPRAWLGFVLFDVLLFPAALVRASLHGRPGAAFAKLRGLVDGFRGLRVTPDRVQRYLRRDR